MPNPISTLPCTTLGLIGPSGGNGFSLLLASSKEMTLTFGRQGMGAPPYVTRFRWTEPGSGVDISEILLTLEKGKFPCGGGRKLFEDAGLRGWDLRGLEL